MIARKSFLLLALLFGGVPSNLGFQSMRSPRNNNIISQTQNVVVLRSQSSASTAEPSSSYGDRRIKTRSRKVPSASYRSYKSPQGQEWINKSIEYYTKVMRKTEDESTSLISSKDERSRTAKRLYHAIQQVRSGNLNRAEHIYRRTISDIQKEDGGCANAELATTTLLLALVLQRMDNIQEARMVFHRFFRKVATSPHEEHDSCTQCTCTAKVLGAYALFEMKFGSVHRSIEVARQATQFDSELSTLFSWKQFRDIKRKRPPSVKRNAPTNAAPVVAELKKAVNLSP